jgi:hypothetical protein
VIRKRIPSPALLRGRRWPSRKRRSDEGRWRRARRLLILVPRPDLREHAAVLAAVKDASRRYRGGFRVLQVGTEGWLQSNQRMDGGNVSGRPSPFIRIVFFAELSGRDARLSTGYGRSTAARRTWPRYVPPNRVML